jgi:Fe2+ or Zn2+ uptake regulation protein
MATASTGGADLHTVVAARLDAADQRYTANRRSLVDVLEAAEAPLTIPDLLSRRRDLAQSSAYRNLAVLEETGVVHRIVTSDEFARYELAEDLTGHHHHLICSACGDVADFTVSAKVERTLDKALLAVAADAGFAVEHHRLDLVGTCARCE